MRLMSPPVFRCLYFERAVIHSLECMFPGNVNFLAPFGNACLRDLEWVYEKYYGTLGTPKVDWGAKCLKPESL